MRARATELMLPLRPHPASRNHCNNPHQDPQNPNVKAPLLRTPLANNHRPASSQAPPSPFAPASYWPGRPPVTAVAMRTPPPRRRPEGGARRPWGRAGLGQAGADGGQRAAPAPGPAPAPMHGAEEAVAAGGPRMSAASTQTDSMAGEHRSAPAVWGLGGGVPGRACPAARERCGTGGNGRRGGMRGKGADRPSRVLRGA